MEGIPREQLGAKPGRGRLVGGQRDSLPYSKVWTHRNRLAGGSQSIFKCAREIEPTVSQFLNVHGKFSESRVSRVTPVLDIN